MWSENIFAFRSNSKKQKKNKKQDGEGHAPERKEVLVKLISVVLRSCRCWEEVGERTSETGYPGRAPRGEKLGWPLQPRHNAFGEI